MNISVNLMILKDREMKWHFSKLIDTVWPWQRDSVVGH